MKTQTLETIEKGSLVWVFDEITEFEYFFKFVYAPNTTIRLERWCNQRPPTKETKINTKHNENQNIYKTQNK